MEKIKELYENVKIKLVLLDGTDVIRTSGGDNSGITGTENSNDGLWTPDRQ